MPPPLISEVWCQHPAHHRHLLHCLIPPTLPQTWSTHRTHSFISHSHCLIPCKYWMPVYHPPLLLSPDQFQHSSHLSSCHSQTWPWHHRRWGTQMLISALSIGSWEMLLLPNSLWPPWPGAWTWASGLLDKLHNKNRPRGLLNCGDSYEEDLNIWI